MNTTLELWFKDASGELTAIPLAIQIGEPSPPAPGPLQAEIMGEITTAIAFMRMTDGRVLHHVRRVEVPDVDQ